MKTNRTRILVAILILSAFGLGWAIRREPEQPERIVRTEPDRDLNAVRERDTALEQLREERSRNAELEREVTTLRQPEPEPAVVAPPSKPTAPPTEAELKAGLQEFGENLRSIILGGEAGKQASENVRELLQRAGPEAVAKLIGRFEDDTESMGARVVIAHALAQSNDPVAIEALAAQLRDVDAGMLVHRFASHALAFSEADGVDVILSQVAHYNPDLGARANASFGLARKGSEEGLALYFKATDEAFEGGDPQALQYLGGLRLLGDKVLPGVRERLLTYTNTEALLVMIGGVKASNDVESVPVLEKLAADGARPTSVRKAAEAALRVLRKTN
jgi:hypothetical protein